MKLSLKSLVATAMVAISLFIPTSLANARTFEVDAVVTAYTADEGALTYLEEKPIHKKTCAVDPRYIPLGSQVYIPNIGWCRANDTGGVVKGFYIDVFINDYNECIQWGRKRLKILFIPPKTSERG